MATWRQFYRPIIQEIISENRGKTEKETRAALRDAKPGDARTFSSVNAVWLDEIKKQLAVLFPKTPPAPVTCENCPAAAPEKSACFICEDERRAGRWIPENHCPNCREAPNAPTDAPRPKPRPWIPGEQLTFFQVDGFLPETA